MKQKHGDTEGTKDSIEINEVPIHSYSENKMQTFEEVLKDLGMEEHVKSFKKVEVTIKDVLKMNEEDIEEMCDDCVIRS